MGSRGLALASLDDAWRFAQLVAKSNMAPKDFIGKPESILIAIQMGAELGLPPMAALQNIAVINGRPSVWGDCALALVQSHPQYEWHEEKFEGEGDTRVAIFRVKRKGHEVHETRFGWADAKRAKLAEKDTYRSYPDRMIQMRARGFGLRDKFADALRGMITSEEAQDYPGTTLNAAQIEQEDAEKKLRDEAEQILTSRGFNQAQRTARIGKNAGKMAAFVEKLKSEENPPKQAEGNGTVVSTDGNTPAATSSTPEGQDPVTSVQSRESLISGVVTGAESAPRESVAQPSGPKAPPSDPTPVQQPAKPQPASATRQNGGRNARFTF
jgi:polyhydroxyalkanoate synthesis regulator phasin